jgi:hypothetical protein
MYTLISEKYTGEVSGFSLINSNGYSLYATTPTSKDTYDVLIAEGDKAAEHYKQIQQDTLEHFRRYSAPGRPVLIDFTK